MSLRVEGLSHSFSLPESRLILAEMTWALDAGEQALLRGISGSGKTTLFNILAGLLRPSSGGVFIDDQSLYALPEASRDRFRSRQIGYVFQNHHLIPSLTALDNVIMPLAFARATAPSQWRKDAQSWLERVGLAEHMNKFPAQLSMGQRLRVAAARALANQPRLLLADEPTAALDSGAGAQVMDLLQEVCRARGAILLVASHDPALVERFERVADLHAGQLSWMEPVRI